MLYRLTPRSGVSLKHRRGARRYNNATPGKSWLSSLAHAGRDYKSNCPVDYRREDHNFDWLGSIK